jgi:hypothetical protein
MPSRKEILTREVTEKLRLEAIVKPGIRKIFKRVVDDFRVSVARTGQAPSLSRHRTSFETLLEDHYRRVQKSFGGMILKQNNVTTYMALRSKQAKQNDAEEESRIKELIAAIFLLWDDERAPVQADIIVATTVRDMGDAIDQGRQAMREDGAPIENRSLAAVAAAILLRILRGRVDLIAVTETQAAAEAAKAIEASTVGGVTVPGIPVPRDAPPIFEPPAIPGPRPLPTIPDVAPPGAPDKPGTPPKPDEPEEPKPKPEPAPKPGPPGTLKKSWIDMRDKRVRPTHVEAGRRYGAASIPVNEAFIVGGSRMMYPGDTSLGAPIREIANCRCSAQYIF